MNDKNPWFLDEAFDVMFSEDAEFTASAVGMRATLKCCVFPREDVDPFAERDNVSEIKSVSVLMKKRAWTLTDRPAVGDKIKLANGDKYKILAVADEQNWWRITGRSYT